MITSDTTALITLLSMGRITSEKIVNASQIIPAEVLTFSQPNASPEMTCFKQVYYLHSNLSQLMIIPIFITKYWINILIYIENVVVKISIIMGLLMRHHVGTISAHYAN